MSDGASRSALDKLFQLKELCQAGILTDDEFESKKAEILKVSPLELSSDPVERLAQLGELRGYGILTTEEFETRKAEILTLAPIGLAGELEPSADANPAPKAPAQQEASTKDMVVAGIVMLFIVAAVVVGAVAIIKAIKGGGDNESAALPVSEPDDEPKTMNRGYCYPAPCTPLGNIDPYTSRGPNGIGRWDTVRAERPEFYNWSNVKEQLAYSVLQSRICIGPQEEANQRYRLTVTRTHAWYNTDAWLLWDDGSGLPFRDANNDDMLDDNVDDVWSVQVIAYNDQPVREPLSTPEFRLTEGCYYLVAEGEGVAVLQRLDLP